MLAYIPYMDPMGYMFYYFRVFSKALMLNPSTVSKTILGIQKLVFNSRTGYAVLSTGNSTGQNARYTPNYKWINPTYPIYNWGYNPLTKWDKPPSR